ncbi:MAG: hypothetical protein OXI17_02265, partial [Gammaproteobacteria bacterium]|nr:hypothetical protein [Gammaproteobacteria bacterium]
RDVFTASAEPYATRRRRIEATYIQIAAMIHIEPARTFWYAVVPSEGTGAPAGSGNSGGPQ